MQELATEIILTLGQAFEIAYQMALQEQQQSKQEAAEGATADPTPQPPPEGAGVECVTTTSQPDGSRGSNSHDKQTDDVNSEIDDITQRVTNTHIHQSAESSAETTQQPLKNDDAATKTTTMTTTMTTSSKKGPERHPDSSRTNKSRADPKVVDPAGQAAVVGTAALGQQHTACHNTTRTESTV